MNEQGAVRNLRKLVVPRAGRLVETGDVWEPHRLVDASGRQVESARAYLSEVLASGRAVSTARSYGMDLLRWFRFLWAIEAEWDRAGRADGRDFSIWFQRTAKRRPGGGPGGERPVNPITGKRAPGSGYAPGTVVHSETVLRAFYDFHLEGGTGLLVNPFPLVAERGRQRAHAHRHPLEPWRNERMGRYRPRVPRRVPPIEGLQVSLAGAQDKIAQIDSATTNRSIDLGMPIFSQIAGRS